MSILITNYLCSIFRYTAAFFDMLGDQLFSLIHVVLTKALQKLGFYLVGPVVWSSPKAWSNDQLGLIDLGICISLQIPLLSHFTPLFCFILFYFMVREYFNRWTIAARASKYKTHAWTLTVRVLQAPISFHLG